jgi:integrase
LAEALAAFKSEYTPGDPQTKRNAERTLDRFVHGGELSDGRKVRGLGGGKLLAEVAPQDVDRWLDDYPNNNKASTIHRRAHLSIFFSTCQRVFDMAFTPFTSGKLKTRGDLLTIYKKRAPPAIKRVDDLKMLLDALDDDLYWQSWVAFACLAGPRWSEQQVLLAAAVDLDAVPPRVIFQATEAGDMKTVGNAVLIERNLLLPILRRFATTWEPRRLLAWPSLRENRKRGGEPVPDGAWRYNTFSRVLKAVLAKARQRSRDPNHDLWRFGPAEWRHTFGTLLALSGMNHSEVANWMRNSSQVAAACYVNFNPPDERVKDQLRWQ